MIRERQQDHHYLTLDMYELVLPNSSPFHRHRGAEPETFDHLFRCIDGLYCPQSLKRVTLQNLANTNDIDKLKQIGCFLLKYQKYRDVYEGR